MLRLGSRSASLFKGTLNIMSAVCVSPDGRKIFSGSFDKQSGSGMLRLGSRSASLFKGTLEGVTWQYV